LIVDLLHHANGIRERLTQFRRDPSNGALGIQDDGAMPRRGLFDRIMGGEEKSFLVGLPFDPSEHPGRHEMSVVDQIKRLRGRFVIQVDLRH
jgi:hypothetical protein